MFSISLEDKDISARVKSVIGIPDVFLNDDTITSPDFKDRAEIYINSQLSKIQNISIKGTEQDLIDMSAIYYISYLLCISMPIRLPQRMENISTKTLLQNIDWYKFGEEMLGRCDDLLNKILEDNDIVIQSGTTMIALSDEMSYPNTSI